MAEYEVRHDESWTLHITPSDGETWPDCKVPYSRRDAMMRPESIHVFMRRNASKPGVSLQGVRLKQDGTPGLSPVKHALYGDQGYDWVYELAEKARRFAGLGPGRTGVDW
jgi:hypothetical protein